MGWGIGDSLANRPWGDATRSRVAMKLSIVAEHLVFARDNPPGLR